MGFGLFGKLPQKRDFVSVNLPNSVLNPFETWLQSCISASRTEIGRDWDRYYLVAPIWHFWIGPEVFGTTCAGALMPSVDQVGRYFPLSIIYFAEAGETLPAPLLAPLDEFYTQLDHRLLAVLSEQREFEVAAVISGLAPPMLDGAMADVRVIPPGGYPVAAAAPPPPPPEAAEPAAPPPPPEPVAVAEPEPEPPPPEPVAADPVVVDEQAEAAVAAALATPEAGEASPWDDAGTAADAAPAAKPAASSSWDDLPDIDAKDFGLPEAAAASGIRDRPPTGRTIPPTPASAAAPTRVAELQSTAGAPGAAMQDPSFAQAPILPPPQIYSEMFKGGVDMRIEPQRTFGEALGGLMALDYHNATSGRTYWWCGASPSGYAAFFAKQGLPDPYYFSRMLMWSGNQQ